jgi:hypothetical protein
MRKKVTTAIAALTMCTALCGQNTWRLSPVPLWPKNGDISKSPSDQYVYLEPVPNDYVVAIRGQDGAVDRIVRAPIHNAINPEVAVSVSRDSDGQFRYRYTLSNGVSARTPIQRWAVAEEETGHQLILSHSNASSSGPSSWKGGFIEAKLPGISRDQHEVYQWESPGDGPLGAGQSMSGFEIVSDLAPGFILAAFYGQTSVPEMTQEEWRSLPKPAAIQLRQALGTAWDSKTQQIIGPRFAPDASLYAVQANFLFGVRGLKIENRIGKDSPAASELEAALEQTLLESGRPVPESRLDSLKQRAVPREMTAIVALRLTLESLNSK